MTQSGADETAKATDAPGKFSPTGLANGNYAVTPSYFGHSFNPPLMVTINRANLTAVNSTATDSGPAHAISGSILRVSSGAGATVTLSGAANFSTTADATGNYSFSGLANGHSGDTGFGGCPNICTERLHRDRHGGVLRIRVVPISPRQSELRDRERL
jgi:hypothetical protein